MPQHNFNPGPGGGFGFGDSQMGEQLSEQMGMQSLQQASSTPPAVPAAAPAQPTEGQPAEASQDIFSTLINAPLEAAGKTFLSVSGLDELLHIPLGTESSPADKEKKRVILQRYNQLNEEQKAAAQALFQERLQREKQLQQEEEEKRRAEALEDSGPIQSTSKTPSGAQNPSGTSKKQQMLSKLQSDRKTLSGPQSAG